MYIIRDICQQKQTITTTTTAGHRSKAYTFIHRQTALFGFCSAHNMYYCKPQARSNLYHTRTIRDTYYTRCKFTTDTEDDEIEAVADAPSYFVFCDDILVCLPRYNEQSPRDWISTAERHLPLETFLFRSPFSTSSSSSIQKFCVHNLRLWPLAMCKKYESNATHSINYVS